MKIVIILSLVWIISGCAGVKGLSNLIIENSKRIGEAQTELVNSQSSSTASERAISHNHAENESSDTTGDIALLANPPQNISASVSTNNTSTNGQVVSSTYYNAFTHKDLGDYAWQVLVQLRTQLPPYIAMSPMLVTDFVEYDLSMHNINNVAHHLSAHLQAKAGPLGYHLINPTITRKIQHRKTGNHVFDAAQLDNFGQYRWVLTGTLVQLAQGMKVMAQVIDAHTQQVYATTDVLLPTFIVDQIAQTNTRAPVPSDD